MPRGGGSVQWTPSVPVARGGGGGREAATGLHHPLATGKRGGERVGAAQHGGAETSSLVRDPGEPLFITSRDPRILCPAASTSGFAGNRLTVLAPQPGPPPPPVLVTPRRAMGPSLGAPSGAVPHVERRSYSLRAAPGRRSRTAVRSGAVVGGAPEPSVAKPMGFGCTRTPPNGPTARR